MWSKPVELRASSGHPCRKVGIPGDDSMHQSVKMDTHIHHCRRQPCSQKLLSEAHHGGLAHQCSQLPEIQADGHESILTKAQSVQPGPRCKPGSALSARLAQAEIGQPETCRNVSHKLLNFVDLLAHKVIAASLLLHGISSHANLPIYFQMVPCTSAGAALLHLLHLTCVTILQGRTHGT